MERRMHYGGRDDGWWVSMVDPCFILIDFVIWKSFARFLGENYLNRDEKNFHEFSSFLYRE